MKSYFKESFDRQGQVRPVQGLVTNSEYLIQMNLRYSPNDISDRVVTHKRKNSGHQKYNRPPNISIPTDVSRSPISSQTKSPSRPIGVIAQPSTPTDTLKGPAFACSKFGSSPTPKSLPPPPPHWISSKCHPPQPCHEVAKHIKMLLQMV